MRIFTTLLLSFAAIALLAGCSSSKIAENPAVKADQSSEKEYVKPTIMLANLPQEEKSKLAEPLLENVIVGIKKKDFDVYTTDFVKKEKTKETVDEFNSMLDKISQDLGEYKQAKFIGIIHKKLFDVFIYKAKFSKFDDEVMMRLFLTEEDGKYKVYMFNISLF